MAKPAFIYAFDNLGPERFTELCGALLGSRYKGFGFLVLGGVGPDGGVDAELDTHLGIWQPELEEALFNDIIRPGKIVMFQFKHKVVARAGGQAKARTQLLGLYKCREDYTCELHRQLIVQNTPTDYVLVTNVEVNSQFRSKFIEQCKSENPGIEHYQVIGLDELETWIIMEPQLRHLYFPTIFGPPRFDLQIKLNPGVIAHPVELDKAVGIIIVSVLNVGTVPSYVNSPVFNIIVDGELMSFQTLDFKDAIMGSLNPKPGTALEPGRKHTYRFPLYVLREMKRAGNEVIPIEVLVSDDIGNEYRAAIPENLRSMILE
jgi:hypothetical protein